MIELCSREISQILFLASVKSCWRGFSELAKLAKGNRAPLILLKLENK